MRIKFWSEPSAVRFARIRAAIAGILVTSSGIEVILYRAAPISHMPLSLITGIVVTSLGVSLLYAAVMGKSDKLTLMRTRIAEQKLPIAERKAVTEEDEIQAIKSALQSQESVAH